MAVHLVMNHFKALEKALPKPFVLCFAQNFGRATPLFSEILKEVLIPGACTNREFRRRSRLAVDLNRTITLQKTADRFP
jgi:hypothetical protein